MKIKEVFEIYKAQFSESAESRRLDLALVYRLFNEAYECSGDADIGLIAYQYAGPYLFGASAYSVISSPTIGLALERLAKYSPLITGSSFINLNEGFEDFVITLYSKRLSGPQAPRYIIDAAVAAILGLIHWLAHPLKIQPNLVELPYPKPVETTKLERLFGSRIRFNSQILSLSFSHDIKKIPVFTSNPALEDIHCRYADALLEEQLNGSLVEKVRSAFFSGIAEGKLLSLQDMAVTLRMNKRNLQKSLESVGVTFSEMQESLRKELATNLLAISTLSLKEISSILGFCQLSSLHKACQRWFGSSPGQLRAKHQKI